MRAFRLLNENEIECRISEINKDGKFLKLLLYKTARTDAALLDETYGASGWQNDFKMLDGKLYGGIGIKFGDEWIWRWDCGTESNMEAEKGQASDAFKRAGFKWGLGAELYSAPQIKIYADRCNIKTEGGKAKCYDRFNVKSINYDSLGNISSLEIVNENTNELCFTMNGKLPYIQKPKEEPKEEHKKKTVDDAFDLVNDFNMKIWHCENCGNEIEEFLGKTKSYSIAEVVQQSMQTYNGHVYCVDCGRKMKKNANKERNDS